jgi:hypothetical protein
LSHRIIFIAHEIVMKTTPPSGTIPRFALFFLVPLACAIPARLHAQAVGVPTVYNEGGSTDFGSGAMLNGAEQPGGNVSVTAWFEYGTNTSYGSSTSPTPVSGNPDSPTGFFTEIYGLAPNTLYHFRADAENYLGTGYSLDSTFTSAGPPEITSQPRGANVATGASVTLSVSAYSGIPLYYQWQLNGSNIASATTSSYYIPGAQSSNAGTYVALVSNYYYGDWVVPSSPAVLNVGPWPQPLLQAVFTNGSFAFSWPVYVPGYQLQTSTNLNSTNWTKPAGTPVTNGNTVSIAIPAANAQGYFRLVNP